MQLEVLSVAPTSRNDPGNDDHVMSIALSDNSGWEELIVVDSNNLVTVGCLAEAADHALEGGELFRRLGVLGQLVGLQTELRALLGG